MGAAAQNGLHFCLLWLFWTYLSQANGERYLEEEMAAYEETKSVPYRASYQSPFSSTNQNADTRPWYSTLGQKSLNTNFQQSVPVTNSGNQQVLSSGMSVQSRGSDGRAFRSNQQQLAMHSTKTNYPQQYSRSNAPTTGTSKRNEASLMQFSTSQLLSSNFQNPQVLQAEVGSANTKSISSSEDESKQKHVKKIPLVLITIQKHNSKSHGGKSKANVDQQSSSKASDRVPQSTFDNVPALNVQDGSSANAQNLGSGGGQSYPYSVLSEPRTKSAPTGTSMRPRDSSSGFPRYPGVSSEWTPIDKNGVRFDDDVGTIIIQQTLTGYENVNTNSGNTRSLNIQNPTNQFQNDPSKVTSQDLTPEPKFISQSTLDSRSVPTTSDALNRESAFSNSNSINQMPVTTAQNNNNVIFPTNSMVIDAAGRGQTQAGQNVNQQSSVLSNTDGRNLVQQRIPDQPTSNQRPIATSGLHVNVIMGSSTPSSQTGSNSQNFNLQQTMVPAFGSPGSSTLRTVGNTGGMLFSMSNPSSMGSFIQSPQRSTLPQQPAQRFNSVAQNAISQTSIDSGASFTSANQQNFGSAETQATFLETGPGVKVSTNTALVKNLEDSQESGASSTGSLTNQDVSGESASQQQQDDTEDKSEPEALLLVLVSTKRAFKHRREDDLEEGYESAPQELVELLSQESNAKMILDSFHEATHGAYLKDRTEEDNEKNVDDEDD
ncbi:probable serine/threonine-protein kinase DDB_G0282963 [Uloborus diversus]|uniref:probable serine/threonine-protein kinase DDB_G0282963 n=1 Tax=Uloborus diversus TaxID=327109 RepID=UPI002408FD09|nr:probable serine/threonine-protein kinase DDB_G0282963 [Uloborus diversus]